MKTLFIIVFIIIVDFFSKLFATKHYDIVLNSGLTFGINVNKNISIAITTIVFLVVIFYFYKYKFELNEKQKIGFIFLIGGGASNLFERILFGHVTDFIYIFNGIFNIADIIIFSGILILIVSKVSFLNKKFLIKNDYKN